MNNFKLLLDQTGLNQREAAEWLGVPKARVENWYQGRSKVPDDVMLKIRELLDKQTRAVQKKFNLIKGWKEYYFSYYLSDRAARRDGWPTKSAYDVVLGRVSSMTKCQLRFEPFA